MIMSITYESEPCLISASARVGMAFSHFRGNLMDLDEPTPCYAVSPRVRHLTWILWSDANIGVTVSQKRFA